ncbi:MAG: endonuclease/exonuclease/phosphatase family protein [Bacteroidota bacterium]|nr:endonuclease/exonuclease/phosphatase family protein [Bacteroidota bacterium]
MFGNLLAQTVATDKPTYKVGESITTNFTGATSAKDWVGLYAATSTPGSASPSIDWNYVDGTRSGSNLVTNGSIVFQSGLNTGGNYKVCFLANDGYTIIKAADFTVSNVETLAAFSSNTTFIAPGGSVDFSDQSTNSPTSWLWSFPGGTPSSSIEKNPSVTYSSEGVYDVTLNATGTSGTLQLQKTGFIRVSNQPLSVSLKVMQFNIWMEGTSVPDGLTRIRDVINEVNPDLVCFSEVTNKSGDWTTKIVNALASLGKTYYGGYVSGSDVSLISKYPITSSGPLVGERTVPYTVDINGATIVVCPSHLDYTYYATYLPRGYACGGSGKYAGWNAFSPFVPETNVSAISAQNLSSKRDEQIAAFINYMQNEKRPILLIGDFNEPSCLDWTTKQANLYDHNGVVFEWPTTLALKSNGFVDAYRQVYPDEVLNPGITWPAVATGVGSTSWAPLSDERDRIDYIFYKGTNVTASAASLVGPKGCYVKNVATTDGNGEDVFEASTMPWPSDHKAVTATINFLLVPSGINSINDSYSNIRVFPNPTKGQFTLISSVNEKVSVSILTTYGGEILNKKMDLLANQSSLFDISNVPIGIYILNLVSQGQSQVIKLIKQ